MSRRLTAVRKAINAYAPRPASPSQKARSGAKAIRIQHRPGHGHVGIGRRG